MDPGKESEILKNESEPICSLCGDIGFQYALVPCKKCGFRLQHTYCSRFYPKIEGEDLCCEWCLYEQEKKTCKRSKSFDFLLEISRSVPEESSEENEKGILRISSEKGNRDGDVEIVPEIQERSAKRRSVRCLEKSKSMDRWRNLAKNKLSNRRYKLLADVLC